MNKKTIAAGVMSIMILGAVPAFAATPHHDEISAPHHAVHHSTDIKHDKEIKPNKEVKPAPAPEPPKKDIHKDKKPLPPKEDKHRG